MRVKYFTTAVSAVTLSTCAFVSQANNGMPDQPRNMYWQAPDFNFKPTPPPAAQNSQPARNYSRPPMAPPPQAYRQPPANNYPAAGNRGGNVPPAYRPNMNQMPPNANRGYPPPRGSYSRPNRPDVGASAFNFPGYNRNRNSNRWSNNKFWGRSGPNRWMNPSKGNMEQGWDDMINAPSRMGEMPGGWTAPEVTVPNPIDMGDQIQENVQDLPEQVKNMDVGN